jgi:glycosyltransferase involved in cell wall biosynthesis
LRVLILNWRDPWHPRAGGAELVTLRVAERLARSGWDVEWFSAAYPGCSTGEIRHGIRFVRAGSQLTVHLRAAARYRGTRRFDIVVDEINTIPFYAHRYVAVPTVAYVNQLAGDVWRYEAPALLGSLGMLAEPLYLRPYRDVPVISISKSSVETMRAIGLCGPMHVVAMSVDEEADDAVPEKSLPRDIVVLGRVTPSKRIEHAIDAAQALRAGGWAGNLLIVGSGDARYTAKLERYARERLGERVQFMGRVTNEARTRVLRTASCLWMTSVREGWGLAVTEAARHGTPAVVYAVPGLVDSVSDGKTGYVVEQRPAALAAATAKLFADSFAAFSAAALEGSRNLDWDGTARHFEEVLRERLGARANAASENIALAAR